MHKPHVQSGGRYPVLRALAIWYLIGAALTLVGVVVGIGYIFARAPGGFTDHLIMTVGALIAGFFVVVSMLAVAEVLKLFIDIEHNTRVNAPGRIGMPAAVVTTASPGGIAVTSEVVRGDGAGGRLADLDLDEETAEAALLRGH
jgi:hypothetical protein